jgi:hypothetical protein
MMVQRSTQPFGGQLADICRASPGSFCGRAREAAGLKNRAKFWVPTSGAKVSPPNGLGA